MTNEQIVKLWNIGYSKEYIVDLYYHYLKSTGIYKRESAKQLKQIAFREIEDILLSEYRTRYKS